MLGIKEKEGAKPTLYWRGLQDFAGISDEEANHYHPVWSSLEGSDVDKLKTSYLIGVNIGFLPHNGAGVFKSW
jgi:hypothetical protein